MTAKEREKNKAPTSEVSWVRKALLVVCVGFFFSILHVIYQEWRKSSTELYFLRFLHLMKEIL